MFLTSILSSVLPLLIASAAPLSTNEPEPSDPRVKVYNPFFAQRDRARLEANLLLQHPSNSTTGTYTTQYGSPVILKPLSIQRRSVGGGEADAVDQDRLDNYIVDVYVGTSPEGVERQKIPAILDTGSSQVLIPMPECAKCSTPLFNPALSSTFEPSSTRFLQKFSGILPTSAEGYLARDRLAIRGAQLGLRTFGGLTRVTGDLVNGFASAVVGLGYPRTPSADAATEVFGSLVQEKKLQSNLFAIHMSATKGASIDFGELDETKYKGDFGYHPLVHKEDGPFTKSWIIQCDGLGYDEDYLQHDFNAIVDTGATLIMVPQQLAKAFYAQIPGAVHYQNGEWAYPCDLELKNLWLVIGGVGYEISPAAFNMGEITDFPYRKERMCSGGVMTSRTSGYGVIGGVFLTSYYAVFDYDNDRVGFALRSDE